MMYLKNYNLKNKTAVVTGFSGFIGTTFTMQLLKRGWNVYEIDTLTHVSNRKLTAQKQENFNFENRISQSFAKMFQL